MKQAFRKNIFRTIKKSMGRYIAILAIIALGVGFFSGLKVSKPAMMKTGQEYVKQQNMYDYRLVSTWGFEESEIQKISEIDGVQVAEGAVWEDFIYQNDENDSVCIKALSITEQVNKLSIESGRLPEAANECVLDANNFSEDMIGKEIKISEANKQETKDGFVYDTYTVTGTVRSPLYMNMERGTTTIGNGKISSFVFIPLEGFSFDYYKEVYVTTGIEETAFTQAYEKVIEAGADNIEAHTLSIIDVRYQEEMKDANIKIADAEQEIADAEQEIADAEKKIADGEKELADGEKEIADAEREIADGEQKLVDGQKEIADGEKEILDAKEELIKKENEARQELADAKKKLEDGQKQLEDGRQQLAEGKATLEEKEQELLEGEQKLLDGKKQYQQGLKEYKSGYKKYEKGLKEYEAGLEKYETGLAEYELGKEELEGNRSQYEQTLAAKQQMESLMTPEMLQQNPDYLQIVGAVSAFETGLQELDAAKGQLDAAKQELDTGKTTLDQSKKELDKAKKQLDSSLKTIEKNETSIADGKKQIKEGKQELLNSEQKLNESEKTIADGWKEYNDGLAELEQQLADARTKIADGEKELEEGRKELVEGKQELEEGKVELADGKKELEEGKQELEEGKVELADGKKELEEGKQELLDAKEELADVEAPEIYVLNRSMNIGCASYESDVGIVDGIAKIFPIFFFLIAALVCSTTMTRMVDDERTQIGTLRAMGYSEGAILMKYVIYSGSAAGIGALSGYFIGTRLFPWAIWTAYGMMYGFADIILVDNIGLLILSILVSFLCSAGTTFAACRLELSHAPAELIRPKSPSAGKRILLERIPFIWKHMKFLHKVSARNIFRFKKRMIMMILGIAGCTALVVAGFGVRDSVANTANNQYDFVMKYHINATYTEEITSEMLAEIEQEFGQEISYKTVLLETSVDAPFENGTKTVTLMASEDENLSNSVDFHLKDKKVELPKKGEILIDERLAEILSADIGEEIVLKVGDVESKPLKVAGIFKNYNFYYAYVTGETYQEYFGEEFVPKTLYVTLKDGIDHYKVGTYLSNMENAANISVIEDTRKMVENTMTSMNFVIILVIACAAALAFIVLFNLGNINISERVREIATLKVLGFYSKETGAYVFRESAVLSIMGIIVGLPLGMLFHQFVMLQVKVDMVSFGERVQPLSYVYSALAVWSFTVCVDLIMRKKINGINMAEALKSIE